MNEEAIAQIERMFREGKISEDDKVRLKEALGYKDGSAVTLKKIEIRGFKSDDVRIEGNGSITAPVIKQGSDYINIERDNETVKITPKPNLNGIGFLGWGSRSEGNRVSLLVPKNIEEIIIGVVSGDIEVSGIIGKLDISVVSGDIKIENFKGSACVSSISGDLELKGIEGTVELNTKSGDIDILDSKIEGMIKGYSGDISMENCSLSKTR
ncbi:MAG: DUF4097 family beta strand repeat-containing protein, partial [Caldisericaceae bacterium]